MITEPQQQADPLIPVFVPALIVLLINAEKEKKTALTEDDVIKIRDHGACIMMKTSDAIKVDEKRGYNDIDPNDCWNQWLEYKAQEQ